MFKHILILVLLGGCVNKKASIVDQIRSKQKEVDSLNKIIEGDSRVDEATLKTAALYRSGKKELDSLNLELKKY